MGFLDRESRFAWAKVCENGVGRVEPYCPVLEDRHVDPCPQQALLNSLRSLSMVQQTLRSLHRVRNLRQPDPFPSLFQNTAEIERAILVRDRLNITILAHTRSRQTTTWTRKTLHGQTSTGRTLDARFPSVTIGT